MKRPIVVRNWLSGDIRISRKSPAQHRKNFNAILKAAARAARECNQKWRVNSGYRSFAEQAFLYDLYINHGGNLAAKPGSSNHNYGKALDISAADGTAVGSSAKRKKALQNNGLCLPVPGEKWHVEFGNTWKASRKPR